MKKRRHPQDPTTPEAGAAYDVAISSNVDVVSDHRLLEMLEQMRPEIARALTVRAERRFGAAYLVEIQEGRFGSSIHAAVLLAVRYPVRAVADTVGELRRFAGEIELEVVRGLGLHDTQVQVVAELDEDSLPAGDTPAKDSGSWDRIAPFLGAVATGIGVLGLVTFVGGAIDWARFRATGLPKERSLSVIPTSDLVVVGAGTLAPAVLWGLLACALYTSAALLGSRERRRWNPRVLKYAEEHSDTTRALFLALTVGVFEVLAFVVTLESPNTLQFVVFILLGGLLVLLTYAVATNTDRFLFLAVTIFLALSIFLSGIAYARARSTPELRAAAVVRENQKAVIGFFIAENGSRVYLARLNARQLENEEIDRSSTRLIGIDKDEVSSIEVGAPTEPTAALEQAKSLAEELCDLEIPRAPDPKRTDEDQSCWTGPPGGYEDEEIPPPPKGPDP